MPPLQVALKPGQAYSPFLLYGGTGLGKTHLLHAAGNLILRNNPRAKVLYVRSEEFIRAMIHALQQNKMDQFKRSYRSVDALLIDDIQFLAGRIAPVKSSSICSMPLRRQAADHRDLRPISQGGRQAGAAAEVARSAGASAWPWIHRIFETRVSCYQGRGGRHGSERGSGGLHRQGACAPMCASSRAR